MKKINATSDRAATGRVASGSEFSTDDRLLPLAAVMQIVGLSKTMIYRLERKHAFPKRYKPGGSATRWSEREVREWCQFQR